MAKARPIHILILLTATAKNTPLSTVNFTEPDSFRVYLNQLKVYHTLNCPAFFAVYHHNPFDSVLSSASDSHSMCGKAWICFSPTLCTNRDFLQDYHLDKLACLFFPKQYLRLCRRVCYLLGWLTNLFSLYTFTLKVRSVLAHANADWIRCGIKI